MIVEKVCNQDNLLLAFQQVKKNKGKPGIDGQTVEQFEVSLPENLHRISQELRAGIYRPQPGRRVMIPKAAKGEYRPLYIPTQFCPVNRLKKARKLLGIC
jgi:RNA-directed DNA polymerase